MSQYKPPDKDRMNGLLVLGAEQGNQDGLGVYTLGSTTWKFVAAELPRTLPPDGYAGVLLNCDAPAKSEDLSSHSGKRESDLDIQFSAPSSIHFWQAIFTRGTYEPANQFDLAGSIRTIRRPLLGT